MIELPSPSLIGMVHLAPLPGSARSVIDVSEISERAVRDALTLQEAGFDALMIENFGDVPFAKASMPPASVAGLAVVADRVSRAVPLPLGINALRNDAQAALGIAAVVGARFIRINVHSGVYATDQGMIEGNAACTLAYRKQLGRRIAIFADVHVKHAIPISEPDIAQAAKHTAYRGLADALIVSGRATGESVNLDQLATVKQAVPDRKLFVGSGATAETVRELLQYANGVIVGSSLKEGGVPDCPIDAKLARTFVAAVRSNA